MKERLDVLLIKKGLCKSRELSKECIKNKMVSVDGKIVDKPGAAFEDTVNIVVEGETLKYVSRGGRKLEKALKVFDIDINGFTCIDLGASTGGFTDCMLQNGAQKVYAVDVGSDQLAEILRRDSRVVSYEKTNAKDLTNVIKDEEIDLITADVSFISLTKIFQPIFSVLKDKGLGVFLVKPQFEAGRENLQKKGVVKDKRIHEKVLINVSLEARKNGLFPLKCDYSPIKGPEGNIEYLLFVIKEERSDEEFMAFLNNIPVIVLKSHEELKEL